jgi:acyl-CoA hydrolase
MKLPSKTYDNVERCVEDTLTRLGNEIVLGTPLGLGKANHIVNEFFRRASEDQRIQLRILTALSLAPPKWKSDIERRYIQPLVERLFGGYEELTYIDALLAGTLPPNVRVTEFYFQPGAYMGNAFAQQEYVSSNYTHATRDILDAGVNVLAQSVSAEEHGGRTRYSLSCNTDLTLDLVPEMRRSERNGQLVALLGQVNRNLPFMYGDAEIEADAFDALVDHPDYAFRLFGVPNRPVTTQDYLLALHVSGLVRDGGTLQIGIGSLGDAICELLKMRHRQNDVYLEVIKAAGVRRRFGPVLERIGGTGPFEKGLYASSEMLVDGFLELYRAGVLSRRAYGHSGMQRLLNEGVIGEEVDEGTIDALLEAGIIGSPIKDEDVHLLKQFGIFRPEVSWQDGSLAIDGQRLEADLEDSDTRREITRHCLGRRLAGGHVAHACFFLGPESFYDGLRALPPEERRLIQMTGISYVNELFGDEELKRLQRRDARFINAGVIATLSGAVASDGLEDGRVISGVGGQYNFVAMAHALEDGRSILMIPATREDGGEVTSNIRFTYGHTTIPRHLRDFIVTEYGIADLRGKSDAEVAAALIEVADHRFQDGLIEEAKAAGKLPASYQLPDHARANDPDRLEETLRPFREQGHFERFPFGTDLTEEEITLKKALTALKQTITLEDITLPGPSILKDVILVPDEATPYLERMGLAAPSGPKEVIEQRAVVFGLSAIGAI